MEEQLKGGVIHHFDPKDVWPDMEFKEVYSKVKLSDTPKNHIIVTCNPTGPNHFLKNIIDYEQKKEQESSHQD